jgi:hypothetical protein
MPLLPAVSSELRSIPFPGGRSTGATTALTELASSLRGPIARELEKPRWIHEYPSSHRAKCVGQPVFVPTAIDPPPRIDGIGIFDPGAA